MLFALSFGTSILPSTSNNGGNTLAYYQLGNLTSKDSQTIYTMFNDSYRGYVLKTVLEPSAGTRGGMISINASTLQYSNNSATVMVWVKIPSGTPSESKRIAFQTGQVNGNQSLELRFNTSANTFSFVYSGIMTTFAFSLYDKWNHFVFAYSGTECVFYLNGVATSTTTYTAAPKNSIGNIYIAGDNAFTISMFIGYIDDFYIYNYKLSATQINTIYNKQRVP